ATVAPALGPAAAETLAIFAPTTAAAAGPAAAAPAPAPPAVPAPPPALAPAAPAPPVPALPAAPAVLPAAADLPASAVAGPALGVWLGGGDAPLSLPPPPPPPVSPLLLEASSRTFFGPSPAGLAGVGTGRFMAPLASCSELMAWYMSKPTKEMNL